MAVHLSVWNHKNKKLIHGQEKKSYNIGSRTIHLIEQIYFMILVISPIARPGSTTITAFYLIRGLRKHNANTNTPKRHRLT